MKKPFCVFFLMLLMACSAEKENLEVVLNNNQPQIIQYDYRVNEHSSAGTIIGAIIVEGSENSKFSHFIDNESGLEINEQTGVLSIGSNLKLDFETTASLAFTVTVSNDETTLVKDLILLINDVNEFELLSDSQKEIINYFKYLTLWHGPYHASKSYILKWAEPMKIFLDGTITNEFKSNVNAVLNMVNALNDKNSFNITLVDDLEHANTHLFFGENVEIEALWPDMFTIIKDKNYSGYSITKGSTSTILSSRIWISNPLEALFMHELGHSIGLGHSNLCNKEDSFMCSTIASKHKILPSEQVILQFLYNDEIPGGLREELINKTLANLILLN